MMFWLVAAALGAAVALSLLFALRPKPHASGAGDFDLDFYSLRRQEIERQAAKGEMSADEARLALAEAGRRLIAVKADASAGVAGGDGRRVRLAGVLVLLILPAITLPLYLATGKPGLSAKPYATRTDLNRSEEDLARLIAKLDAHLAESPDDAKGFELAFPVYMRLGRFDSAVHAAQRLVALRGATPERFATLAEALIYNARGIVGEEATAAIDSALAGDPRHARARFFRGLAHEQAGRFAEARATWQALADDLPEGQEKATVLNQVARLSAGPANEAADAIRTLPEGERKQAILGMVEGLAQRLKSGGGTLDEWLRLIRARAVLGDRPAALAALADARADLSGRDGAPRLDALARELGLTEAAP